MIRSRIAVVAALVGVSVAGASLLAQKAPEMKPILAGKKVEPPVKGQAEVDFVQPVTKRNGDVVTTTIRVKNTSTGPIARLTIAETWFDKSQAPVATSQGALDKPLDPGAVDTVTIQTPWNAKMSGNSWQFTHANGTIKPRRVPKLEDPSKGAAKAAPATAKAAPAKKK
jgi:hypothetical protein